MCSVHMFCLKCIVQTKHLKMQKHLYWKYKNFWKHGKRSMLLQTKSLKQSELHALLWRYVCIGVLLGQQKITISIQKCIPLNQHHSECGCRSPIVKLDMYATQNTFFLLVLCSNSLIFVCYEIMWNISYRANYQFYYFRNNWQYCNINVTMQSLYKKRQKNSKLSLLLLEGM